MYLLKVIKWLIKMEEFFNFMKNYWSLLFNFNIIDIIIISNKLIIIIY